MDGIGFELVAEALGFGGSSDGEEKNVGKLENEEVAVHSTGLGEFCVVHSESQIAVLRSRNIASIHMRFW